VQAFGYAMLKAAMPPPSFAGPDVDRDFSYAVFCAEEQVAALERAIRDNDYTPTQLDVEDPLVHSGAIARRLASEHGIVIGQLPAPRATLLHQGVARAQAEEPRLYLHRLNDQFAPYQVRDQLFAQPALTATPASQTRRTFEAAVEKYRSAKSGVAWTARTEEENCRILRLAGEHFGASI
jgi:hypothetical protein